MIYKINTWVRIHKIISKPEEQTEKESFEMWIKGYLLTPAKIGDWVTIKTLNGREEEGKLIEAYPEQESSGELSS
ncbi:MAG: hypothetical protein PHV87_07970 [Bacilli bacterium]|nr:hypothetical protein [Bacilli bacterium]